eukprot:512067-Amphidinium_carterae.5
MSCPRARRLVTQLPSKIHRNNSGSWMSRFSHPIDTSAPTKESTCRLVVQTKAGSPNFSQRGHLLRSGGRSSEASSSPDTLQRWGFQFPTPLLIAFDPNDDDETKALIFAILSRSVAEFRTLLRRKIRLWRKWAADLEARKAELKESLDVGRGAILKDFNLLPFERILKLVEWRRMLNWSGILWMVCPLLVMLMYRWWQGGRGHWEHQPSNFDSGATASSKKARTGDRADSSTSLRDPSERDESGPTGHQERGRSRGRPAPSAWCNTQQITVERRPSKVDIRGPPDQISALGRKAKRQKLCPKEISVELGAISGIPGEPSLKLSKPQAGYRLEKKATLSSPSLASRPSSTTRSATLSTWTSSRVILQRKVFLLQSSLVNPSMPQPQLREVPGFVDCRDAVPQPEEN